jgi:acyl transferase domain-containing protein/NADPH:quinone reductase-like Zn-dependent oxidoreductase/NAD(P)-dependent dehydrogenase (short-subunit alcohol dehydrogenase family)/acyl carrier protein
MSSCSPEKFAIVGIGCRMPPNASSLSTFWRFLVRGGNALKPIKADRWDWRQYWDEDPNRPGKTYAPKGAFLDADVKQFDPLAFGMSPREAASLDPQQRLLLESAWEAFDDAGYPLKSLAGSSTGVFVGGFCLDHLLFQTQPSNRHLINAHAAGGVMMTVLSNRLSHAFDLKGPSLTLDTACSSSLVALHYACQSLRLRECDMALAGGVNVMMRPEFPIIMSKGHFLSDHGECHTFDETASGYARGEGAGLFLLKRYDDAVAAGDQIHAVIRATGVNQDGHTDGISLPNTEAQETLIRKVYAEAGVDFADVDYVEAHGTGTQAGDAAELGALHRSFHGNRDRKLIVGSVKTNVGHLEAAAGVAGLLKVIGILKNRQVPKNLHYKKPNPKIPFADYCVQVAGETHELPKAGEKPVLYAGINSFGYGGTNAHALLESAPVPAPSPAKAEFPVHFLPLSARNEKALRDMAGKVAFQIGQSQPGSLADLAHSCAFRRNHLEYRGAVLTKDFEELKEQLIALSTGQVHEGVTVGSRAVEPGQGLVFVYTGMGPQWWGMGQELMRSEAIVKQTVEEIDGYFRPLAGWSLEEAMMAKEAGSRMAHTEVAQPANFALQVALTRLWESMGIRPAAVVGHSVGEVVSAYVAGVYTLEEAVQVSYHRSRLQQTMAGQGAMLAAGLTEEEAEKILEGYPGVSVAAVNSFNAVTLSGDAVQLKEIAASLEAKEIFQKFLRVEVAYHSPQMDPLKADLLASLAGLSPKAAKLPLYSTAYGEIVPAEKWDAEYWWRNVRQPVHFAAAVQQLFSAGYTDFLEVGPHPVLGNSLKECASHLGKKIACFPSLRRAEPERPRIWLSLAELYVAGHDPEWTAVVSPSGNFLPAPQYPWQRQFCWNESDRSRMERLGLPGPVYLNRTVPGPLPCWEVEINRNYFPFLSDHIVQDQTVFAGMGYVEAALALGKEVYGTEAMVLENVNFERVLVVDPSKLQYLLSSFDRPAGKFRIQSRTEGEEGTLQTHCSGRLRPLETPVQETMDLKSLRARCPATVEAAEFYEQLKRRDLNYGPAFQPVRKMGVSGDHFLAEIDISPVRDAEDHPLHPVIFDAALQAIIFCAKADKLFVPFTFGEFAYLAPVGTSVCHAYGEIVRQTDTQLVADLWLLDAEGQVCVQARGITLQFVDTRTAEAKENLFYEVAWKPAAFEGDAVPNGSEVLVLASEGDSDLALAEDVSVSLPGAAFGKLDADWDPEVLRRLLVEHSRRKQILVFWGSRVDANADAAVLSEKFITLVQALAARSEPVQLMLVTRGAVSVSGEDLANPAAHVLSALGLLAQNETEGLTCRSVDLPAAADSQDAGRLTEELARGSAGDFAWRNGERWESVLAARKKNDAEASEVVSLSEPLELRPPVKGRFDSLVFERAERKAPGGGEVELRILRAGLNAKDVLKIEGRLSPLVLEYGLSGDTLGMEAYGVVERAGEGSAFSPGDAVLAILPRAFRTYATIPEPLVFKVPSGLGADIAGVPVAYLTAYRALIDLAHLQNGERVLVCDAASDAGLAAVDIAMWRGAEVFATTGSDAGRELLKEQGVAHVFDSATLDFAQQIKAMTAQEGVDVVVGAIAGQAMHAGLGLLREGGRYVETGKRDIAEDNDLPLRAFNRNIAFMSLDVDRLALERSRVVRDAMDKVLGHFAAGDFRQRAVRVVGAGELAASFDELASGKAVGKLVVNLSEGEVPCLSRKNTLSADGCYIVTGGTSGFGITTAKWMAREGAGRLLLVSRSGRNAPGIEQAAKEIEALGASVEIVSVDVTDLAQVLALREKVGGHVLRGIVHGAMVLDDAFLADLTEERFRRVFAPKAIGAQNLAVLARETPGLDFLVFYSSVSALVGNAGQASYIAANSLLDGLARKLRGEGVPALSINWGALAESGVVARDERLGGALASGGVTGLTDRQALDALGTAIALGESNVGAFLVDWERWSETNPRLADHPRFHDLLLQSKAAGSNDPAAILRGSLAGSTSDQRLAVLLDHLQGVVAQTLRMPKDGISQTRKLNEMGVDSLLVLELSLGIRERLGISFSAMEFLKGPSLRELAAMAAGKLWSNGN